MFRVGKSWTETRPSTQYPSHLFGFPQEVSELLPVVVHAQYCMPIQELGQSQRWR